MMKIFLLPGLGYDCRIFDKIDWGAYDVEHIDWIEPAHDESLTEYAKRLIGSKLSGQDKNVLIGHSMGGVVAQEIARFQKVDQIILISSLRSDREIPFSFKLLKSLGLYRLFTKEVSIKTVKYWGKDHGMDTEETMTLFKSMVGGMTNDYLQWALKALAGWKSNDLAMKTKILQIHGDNDKTLPIKNLRGPDITIQNGSHFMLYNRAPEINEIINQYLKK